MMLATSAAWFEIETAQTRHATNVHDHIRATQAADGALLLCAQALRAGAAPVLPALGGDRAHWKEGAAFEAAGAYEPVPSWAGSARPPQCVVEAISIAGRPDASGYCITARGFGAKASTEAWLQLLLVTEAGRERRAWRRIVATPVPR
jgi:Tfp pilus assembly protein PilX